MGIAITDRELDELSPAEVVASVQRPWPDLLRRSFNRFVMTGGELGRGGIKFGFSPMILPPEFQRAFQTSPRGGLMLYRGGASSSRSRRYDIRRHLTEPGPHQRPSSAHRGSGSGPTSLVGVRHGQVFCDSLALSQMGSVASPLLEFHEPSAESPFIQTTLGVLGWWISGDLPNDWPAPLPGHGHLRGTTPWHRRSYRTCELEGWTTYVASGDVNMNWDFGTRAGDLAITNFDATHIPIRPAQCFRNDVRARREFGPPARSISSPDRSAASFRII